MAEIHSTDAPPASTFTPVTPWRDGAENHVHGYVALSLAAQAMAVANGVSFYMDVVRYNDLDDPPLLNGHDVGRLSDLVHAACQLLSARAEEVIEGASQRAEKVSAIENAAIESLGGRVAA